MSTGTKVLIGALVGAAAGIVTGVLIAPASGKETRENISEKTDELLEQIKDLVNKKRCAEETEEKE